MYCIGFGLIGVELWGVLAVIAGFGDMIPYMGLVSGLILTSIMTLVTFGDLTHLLMVWGVFAFVQVLTGMVIAPRVLGNKVGLSPLIIILAIFSGGKLFGLLGIILAVPTAAALRVLLVHVHEWLINRDAALKA